MSTIGASSATSIPTPHLTYNGGKILSNPSFYGLFLGQYWKGAIGKREASYLNKMGEAVLKSKHLDILKEYGVKKASYAGSTVLSDYSNRRTISDDEIQQKIMEALSNGQLKSSATKSVMTVYLPPGVTLIASDGTSSRDGMGGYHSSFDTADGKRIYYAAIAYSKGSNGIEFTSTPTDNISITATHEWAEVATDPDVNNGQLGWYDERYGEVGDIPINLGMPLKKIFGRIDGYAVQKEWSNKDGQVELIPSTQKHY